MNNCMSKTLPKRISHFLQIYTFFDNLQHKKWTGGHLCPCGKLLNWCCCFLIYKNQSIYWEINFLDGKTLKNTKNHEWFGLPHFSLCKRKFLLLHYVTSVTKINKFLSTWTGKNNLITTAWLKTQLRYEIATTTNSELNDKVKAYCIEQESDYWVTLHPVKLCLWRDPTSALSLSCRNVNTSGTCGRVSRIVYCDKMIASSEGSHCLNTENTCFDHGI